MYLIKHKFKGLWPSCLLVFIFLGQALGIHEKIDIGFLSLGFGALSALALVVIQIANKKAFHVFKSFPYLIFFIGFITIAFLASVFSEQPGNAVLQSTRLILYFFVMISIAGLDFDSRFADSLITIFLSVLAVMLILSILSLYFGFMPEFFNSNSSKSYFLGSDNAQLTATFASRTALNSYLSLAVGLGFGLLISAGGSGGKRVLLIVLLTVFLISGILTFSRGIFLFFPPIIIFLIYRLLATRYYRTNLRPSDSISGFLKFDITSAPYNFLFIAFVSLILGCFSLLLLLWVLGLPLDSSDMVRVEYFKFVLHSLENNLFGRGILTRYLSFISEHKNSHNNFIQFLDSSGYIGFALFLIFVAGVLVSARNYFIDPIVFAVSCGLLSFLIYGLTHNTYSNLTFWVFFGLLLQRLRALQSKQVFSPRDIFNA